MRLRHIEVFHAIMTNGSLNRAAETLRVSQPAASKVLRHAEQMLGFPLFERTGGRLVPTREAHLMMPRVNVVFEHLSSLDQLTRNLRAGRGGHELRIGCLPSLGLSVIPRVIQRYQEAAPENHVTVDTHHGHELIELLNRHELDLGVVYGSPDAAAGNAAGLVSEHVAEVPLVYLDRGKQAGTGSMRLVDIDPTRWIGLTINDPVADALGELWQRSGIEIEPVIRVRTHYMAAELANLGAGCTVVDAFTALHNLTLPTPRLLDPALHVACFIVFRPGFALSQLARKLLGILRAEFRSQLDGLNQKL